MLSFLSSFTEPFLIALLFWPVLALFLTIPILVIQYRRYGKINIGRGLVAYIVILYGLALISFTLYPMPSNPVEFCRDYALSPQLIPFSFIHEIQADGLRAVLQVGMNLLFFCTPWCICKTVFQLATKNDRFNRLLNLFVHRNRTAYWSVWVLPVQLSIIRH